VTAILLKSDSLYIHTAISFLLAQRQQTWLLYGCLPISVWYSSVLQCSHNEVIITLTCTNRCLGIGFRMILGKERREKDFFFMGHKQFPVFARGSFTAYGLIV